MNLIIPAGARPERAPFTDTAGRTWTLYKLRDSAHPNASFLWIDFKLMLPPDTPAQWGQKRAFSLAWNPAEGRLRRGADNLGLQTGHPAMSARIELYLGLHYGPGWLTDPEGGAFTPDEIAAEHERLAQAARDRRRERRNAR